MGRNRRIAIGTRFGPLTITSIDETRKSTSIYYVALCDCGGSVTLTERDIRKRAEGDPPCACHPARTKADFAEKDQRRVGQKFGRLTYVGRTPHDPKKPATGLFKCDCGNDYETRVAQVFSGQVKSCGCSRISPNYMTEDGNGDLRRWLKLYKQGAKLRSISWEITEDRAFELFRGNCYLCGKEPELRSNRFRGIRASGIDRIDGTGSYTADNTASCCSECNWMKWQMPKNKFIEHLNKMKARMHIWAGKLKGDRV